MSSNGRWSSSRNPMIPASEEVKEIWLQVSELIYNPAWTYMPIKTKKFSDFLDRWGDEEYFFWENTTSGLQCISSKPEPESTRVYLRFKPPRIIGCKTDWMFYIEWR